MNKGQEFDRDLVFIGGGHAHVIALKRFAMNPIPKVRLTVISDVDYAPYSGMLPGYIANYYTYDEIHFDLQKLCAAAGVRLIRGSVVAVDRKNRTVAVAGRPDVPYDVLSINIGSRPCVVGVEGAREYATPIKPLPQFLSRLHELDKQIVALPQNRQRIVIVGGGVGGVETALALQVRVIEMQKALGADGACEIMVLHKGNEIVENLGNGARQRIIRQLDKAGIEVHVRTEVVKITDGAVTTTDGRSFFYNQLFWVTRAAGHPWLKESGLPVTADGFLRVNQFLQVVGEKDIFAAGDTAHMDASPRPKAGVFAVRQGRPLYENLRRQLCGHSLRAFRPQTHFLTLVGVGRGTAVASRGLWAASGNLMWKWKESIDRKFMQRFSTIPAMINSVKSASRFSGDSVRVRCHGCGAKVAAAILRDGLEQLESPSVSKISDGQILTGAELASDAAVIRPPAGQLLVQTVDLIPAMGQDLFLFGRIATLHSLSDLFAVGATPHSALATCILPYQESRISARDLRDLLAGVTKELSLHGCSLVGGHTTESSEVSLGLSCNGFLDPSKFRMDNKFLPGDAIVLTKALGVGTILRAHMMGVAEGRWVSGAISSMLHSNGPASKVLEKYSVSAATDVTGFGLVGHLRNLLPATGVAVSLFSETIPSLPGALSCLALGMESSISESNRDFLVGLLRENDSKGIIPDALLTDPQTSGGLIVGVKQEQAETLVAELRVAGYCDAAVIGKVESTAGGLSTLKLF